MSVGSINWLIGVNLPKQRRGYEGGVIQATLELSVQSLLDSWTSDLHTCSSHTYTDNSLFRCSHTHYMGHEQEKWAFLAKGGGAIYIGHPLIGLTTPAGPEYRSNHRVDLFTCLLKHIVPIKICANTLCTTNPRLSLYTAGYILAHLAQLNQRRTFNCSALACNAALTQPHRPYCPRLKVGRRRYVLGVCINGPDGPLLS